MVEALQKLENDIMQQDIILTLISRPSKTGFSILNDKTIQSCSEMLTTKTFTRKRPPHKQTDLLDNATQFET